MAEQTPAEVWDSLLKAYRTARAAYRDAEAAFQHAFRSGEDVLQHFDHLTESLRAFECARARMAAAALAMASARSESSDIL